MSGHWPTVDSQQCQRDRALVPLHAVRARMRGCAPLKQRAISTT